MPYVEYSKEGLIPIKVKDKYGYINRFGAEIIPCVYDNLGFFNEGLVALQKNGQWRLIDKNGNDVIVFS